MRHVWAVLLAVAPPAVARAADEPVLITNVSVVDVGRGAVTPDRAVFVRNGAIEAVGATGAIKPAAGVRVVDGTALYALPGLFDAHVHLNDPDREARLLVANGVLFARDMGGPTDDRLAARARARKGELAGLGLVVTGTILDGSPPYHAWAAGCDTPEAGRAAVRALRQKGVDQIKVYSRLKPAVYRAILAEAKEQGLKVVGHVPDAVTLAEAAEAGQAGVEHLSRFETLFADLLPARPGPRGAFAGGAWERYGELDPGKLADRLKRVGGVAQCPTLVLHHGQARVPPDARTKAAWAEYVDPPTLAGWTGPVPPQWAEYGRGLTAALPHLGRAVRDQHRAGVPLLVGTDLGNVGVLAGFAVHQEMLLWQEAGVPAPAVLRAATVEPARFLGVGDRYGAVAAGKTASFVLVRKNPLDDVRHAAEIEAVVAGGKLLDRKALDGLLADAREDVLARTPADERVPLDLPGEVVARGKYTLRYQQWEVGTEEFAVARDKDAVRFVSVVRQGGWDVPAVVRGEFAPDGTPRRVTRTTLTKRPEAVEYAAAGGKMAVTGTRGAKPPARAEVEFGDAAVLQTTAAGWYALGLRLADLAVGGERAVDLVSVRGMGPPPDRQKRTAKRLADADVAVGGMAVVCRVYELRSPAGADGPVVRLWMDAAGVPVKTEQAVGSEVRSAVLEPPAK